MQRAIESKKFASAEKYIARVESSKRLNIIESAFIANYRGNLEFEQGNIEQALVSFKDVLEFESDLPLGFSNQIRLVVAQLEFMQKRYEASISHAENGYVGRAPRRLPV